jgi:DNA-binding CsgD family transcriptional regulator
VRDLDTKNGTYVDGLRITQCDILPGVRVRFGNVALVLAMSQLRGLDDSAEEETVSIRGSLESTGTTPGIESLTDAQRRVVEFLLQGLSEKQVAQQLNLSRHTVHNHVRAVYRILDVHTRSELMARLLPEHNGRHGQPDDPASDTR